MSKITPYILIFNLFNNWLTYLLSSLHNNKLLLLEGNAYLTVGRYWYSILVILSQYVMLSILSITIISANNIFIKEIHFITRLKIFRNLKCWLWCEGILVTISILHSILVIFSIMTISDNQIIKQYYNICWLVQLQN